MTIPETYRPSVNAKKIRVISSVVSNPTAKRGGQILGINKVCEI